MKILVTGGTGFLGKRLVDRLIEEGDEVTVLSNEKHESLRIKFVQGNILDKETIEKAVEGAEIVYHLAACLDELAPDMRAINVQGTQNVVDVCKNAKIKQLIVMSSSGVLGETKEPATEDLPYNPETGYEDSKMESEKIVIDSGLPYTIIRAPIVIGPNSFWMTIFGAAKTRYPMIGKGSNYFHLVYVDDVVEILCLAKNNRKAVRQVFHVATDDVNTYRQVYEMISSSLGVEMTTKQVPEWLALLVAGLHEWKCKLTGKKPKLTKMRSSIKRLTRNRIISTQKSKEVLGFQPKFSTKQAIDETLKYLKISRMGYSDYDLAAISKIKR